MGLTVEQTPSGAIPSGTVLIDKSAFLPIPCSLFLEKEAGTLMVEAKLADTTAVGNTLKFLDGEGKWMIKGSTVPWSRLSSQIERELVVPFRKNGITISYGLLVRERVIPVPGDAIVLTRFSRRPQLDGSFNYQEPFVERHVTRITADGMLTIPFATSVAGWQVANESAIYRKVRGRLDLVSHTIPLCPNARKDEHRWCLSDLEDCLNAAPSPGETISTFFAEKCKSLKVDSLILPKPSELEIVRYEIAATERHWTLVLADGTRVTSNFEFGQLASQAVLQAYRRHTGSELFEEHSQIDIRVVGQPGRAGASEPSLFRSQISDDATSPMDSALLLPGDIVFVARMVRRKE
jgi:hypothetical protein